MTGRPMSGDLCWWRGAVIYQIYPRSFQDSNGDGIGDLDGISERLEHVSELGADAIWISPFYPSPMKDFGYDVSDHTDIDPMFGDLTAFDAMLDRAHALGLKVLIDLVLSHTSDQHAWFAESSSSTANARSDWYVWADAKPDGGPPNNWLSIFGGPGWTWHTGRRQYYQHNFLSSQPDLNFHAPAVQDAVLDIARFWLERGVDGFRLDTVNFYFCDAELRDNPPLDPSTVVIELTGDENPYGFQDHVFDKNRPENLAFLERLRTLMDVYPGTTTVGEIGDAHYAKRLLRDYSQGDARLHMCYTFDLLTGPAPDAHRLADTLTRFDEEAGEAWVCWAFSNHDVTRHATRWSNGVAHDADALTLQAAVLLSLRGTVCLYQGEEVGLTEADIDFDDLQDPYGIAFWPAYKGRDGCRTPMVWSGILPGAGFTTGTPWLPIPDEHRPLAVDEQSSSPGTLLERYRALLAFRRREALLVTGSIHDITADTTGHVLGFRRSQGNRSLLCLFNLGRETVRQTLPSGIDGTLLDDPLQVNGGIAGGFGASRESDDVVLPPLAAAWMRLS